MIPSVRRLLACLTLFLVSVAVLPAQDAAPSPAATDLKALVDRLTTKIRAGERSAAALAGEIAEFDALLRKYPEKNDDTAQIAMMRAMLYLQVLGDEARGRELLQAVKADFPGTKPAAGVDRTLAQMDRAAKAKAVQANLVGQPAPELDFTWSSRAGLKKLSDLRGQVVVLDFWATWCGPCISSFPQVREHVTHFAGSPVAFLGVTSLQGFVANMGPRIDTKDDPAKEMALMPDFMKAKEMTWDVVFSSQEVFNPDYGIQGIPYVAIIAPDGTVRHTGLHPGNKAHDISGKVEAILREFKLPVPAAKG